MTASGFPDRDHLGGVAIGYTTYSGAEPGMVANTDTLPWQGASAGGGVASADDMLRFCDAMRCDAGGQAIVPCDVQAGDDTRRDALVWRRLCPEPGSRSKLGSWWKCLRGGRRHSLLPDRRHQLHLLGDTGHGVQPSHLRLEPQDVSSARQGVGIRTVSRRRGMTAKGAAHFGTGRRVDPDQIGRLFSRAAGG